MGRMSLHGRLFRPVKTNKWILLQLLRTRAVPTLSMARLAWSSCIVNSQIQWNILFPPTGTMPLSHENVHKRHY